MIKEQLIMVLLILFVLIAAVGCSELNEVVEQEELLETNGAVVVSDQMGRKVIVEDVPQRIISLSPSNTEVVFALGLDDRVVGVTEYCNYPPEALEKDQVGGFSTPSIERIVELEPELILASTIHEEEVIRLEELGLPVLVVESSTLIDLYTSISLVAEVTGIVDDGEALIDSMRERIYAVESIVAGIDPEDKVRVYYEVYSDPLMSAGKGAFINEIISLAGGVNIFGDINENYPTISAEVVAERQPEIILFPDYHGTADFVLDGMTARPGWESIPAVRENRVYAISDDAFARPGPRVVEAVEEAAEIFYPELF